VQLTAFGFKMLCLAIQAICASKLHFVLHKPEIVMLGKTSFSLYMKVNVSMMDHEKSKANQHNKTVLASADLDQCASPC
jgi:hypothetical protein